MKLQICNSKFGHELKCKFKHELSDTKKGNKTRRIVSIIDSIKSFFNAR